MQSVGRVMRTFGKGGDKGKIIWLYRHPVVIPDNMSRDGSDGGQRAVQKARLEGAERSPAR